MTQKSAVSRMCCLSLPTGIFLPILIVVFTVLFLGAPLSAQVQTGINGTVTDLSGAVIAGAHVTATNTSTASPDAASATETSGRPANDHASSHRE